MKTEAVLFDLGGVLVRLGGVEEFGRMIGEGEESEIWRRWLASPWVRRYERGQCNAEAFAAGMVQENDLDLPPGEFLAIFRAWPRGLLPGAQELVASLPDDILVGCVSNTNELHWNHQQDGPLIRSLFKLRFLSHELGLVKPDREMFEAVLAKLDRPGPGGPLPRRQPIERRGCSKIGDRCGVRPRCRRRATRARIAGPAAMNAELLATRPWPVPPEAQSQTMAMPDKTTLRLARWCPETASRGTFVVLNGRTEYIEKYFEMISELLERKFAVATLDWRGQGRSDRPLANPLLGHVRDFDAYDEDLEIVMQRFVLPSCPGPYRLFAHSMGGTIGLRYLALRPERFHEAIFSAPMWGLGKHVSPGPLLRVSRPRGPATGLGRARDSPGTPVQPPRVSKTTPSPTTRNALPSPKSNGSAIPRLRLGPPTFGWVAAALDAIDRLQADATLDAVHIPALVVTPGADRVVSQASQKAVALRLRHGEQLRIEGARHEILMEQNCFRDRFWQAFDAFVH